MAEAFYEPTPATDGATMNPVPGAVFEVYEIADTSFSTPLSLRVGSGNPTTTVTASDTLATLPGVYVTSPNYEHIWKSGTFEWRRDSIDGAKKAIEDAKIAASNSASDAALSKQAAEQAASLVDAPADTVMRDVAANPASAFAGQLSSTIAGEVDPVRRRTVLGPRWVFDGDSITIGSIINSQTGEQNRGRSWTTAMARASMGRIDFIHNVAVAGQVSVDALNRFDANVAPKNPDVVFLTIGTNDIGQSLTKATWLANVDAYWGKCKAIDAQLVLGLVWPSDDATRNATARDWNKSLHNWARDNHIPVVPWDRLADPANGKWPAGWSTDGTHPGVGDSYVRIGAFGWDAIKDKCGEPVVRRALYNGADLLANGFNTTLNAVLGLTTVTAANDTASGSLAAGTYSYRVTTRGYYGESLPTAAVTTTLAGTGKVTLTLTTVNSNRGYRIYRKGPNDADHKFIGTTAVSATSFVDDGSVVGGSVLTGVDTSAVPTGLNIGTVNLHEINGNILFTETGVRGNILRLRTYEGGGGATDYYVANVIEGELLRFSALVRAAGTADSRVTLRFRSATGEVALMDAVNDRVRPDGFGLASVRVTVPATATTVRVGFESSTGAQYMDVAELLLEKVA